MKMLFESIMESYKDAMRNKQDAKKLVLNTILAAAKNKKIELQRDPTDEEILQLIKKEVKIIQETMGFLEKAAKVDDLAEEQEKLTVLQSYLPVTLSVEATKEIVQKLIADLGLTDVQKQRGQLMGAIMQDYKDKVDPSVVNQVISSL
ncbi:GatB/YqeY domain-containing protein [Patescibacteria group bacterium]|nr:GatB/YqeY domain-containing protein [Patescibacteria group bacterium]